MEEDRQALACRDGPVDTLPARARRQPGLQRHTCRSARAAAMDRLAPLGATPRPHGQPDEHGFSRRAVVLHHRRRIPRVDPASGEMAIGGSRRFQRRDPLETPDQPLEYQGLSAQERPSPFAAATGGHRRSGVRDAGHRRPDTGPRRSHRTHPPGTERQPIYPGNRGGRRHRAGGNRQRALAASKVATRLHLRMGQHPGGQSTVGMERPAAQRAGLRYHLGQAALEVRRSGGALFARRRRRARCVPRRYRIGMPGPEDRAEALVQSNRAALPSRAHEPTCR